MHPRLAEIMDFVEERRRDLLKSVDGVPPAKLARRASPGRWSVAEILEHLRMVETGVARLITKRSAQARASGIGEETSASSVMSSFDRYSALLGSSILQAPQGVQPKSDVDATEALNGLATSRQDLRAAVAGANGLPLGEIKHTHAILGELDLYQWLIFLGDHEVRHRNQIDRTLKSISE